MVITSETQTSRGLCYMSYFCNVSGLDHRRGIALMLEKHN